MENIPAVPETKAADVAGAFDEFRRSFETFKEPRTKSHRGDRPPRRRLHFRGKGAQIGAALDANKRVLDELVLKSRRPALARETKMLSAAEIEHRKAFDTYVRHGETTGLKRPFADAYQVLKEFIETGGELPTCIEWTEGAPIPPEAFAPHLYRSKG